MPETHDHGRLYWHWHHYRKPYGFVAWWRYLRRRGGRPIPRKSRIQIPRPPVWEKANTQMVEEPYRAGHGVSMRLWPTRYAIVAGWWGKPAAQNIGEAEMLFRATQGRMMDSTIVDIRGWGEPSLRWRLWASYRKFKGILIGRVKRVRERPIADHRGRFTA